MPVGMANTLDLRPLVLRALLGAALVAGAAALIALARGEFTDTDTKVILTSLLFGLASTMAAAGVAAHGRSGAARALGALTVVATGVAFGLVLVGLWAGAGGDGFWRPVACIGVVALEGAHASYVVARAREDDPATARSAGFVAVAAAALSGLLALIPISGLGDDDDLGAGYVKLIGAVFVVQTTATVVAPLARRIGGAAPERPLLAVEDPAERLRREVRATADRIEHLTTDARIRVECARLRALADGERAR
jgi:hypothetical protein